MTPEQQAADYFHRLLTVPDEGDDARDLMHEIAGTFDISDDAAYVVMLLVGNLSGSLRDVLDAVDLPVGDERAGWAFERAAMFFESANE